MGVPVCVLGGGGTSCEHPLSRRLLPCCWRGKPSAPSRCARRLTEHPPADDCTPDRRVTPHPPNNKLCTVSPTAHTLHTKAPSHTAGALHIHQRLHRAHQLCSGLFERCNRWAPVGVKRSSQLRGAVRKKSKFQETGWGRGRG